MLTERRIPGEHELYAREMSRGMEGDVSQLFQMQGRRLDEQAAQFDRHLDRCTCVVLTPPRSRAEELAEDRREINLR